MGFGEAVSTCFKKSVVWEGRASRPEFWWFHLGAWLIMVVAGIIGAIIGTWIIYALAGIVLILPSLAVLVRRLHDTNRSGWWYWIELVPLIGVIVILVFVLSASDEGENKYGPNPHGSVAPPPPAV